MNGELGQYYTLSRKRLMTVLVLCCVVALTCFFHLATEHVSILVLLGIKLVYAGVTAAVVAVGLLLSWWNWPRGHPFRFSFICVLTSAYWLGFLSLILIAVRCSYLLAIFCIVLATFTLRCISSLAERLELLESFFALLPKGRMLFGIVSLFAVISFLCAFTPPWEYDEQEYHLGAVAYMLRHEKALCVPANVYSHFPRNAEMLFLLTGILFRHISGDARDGVYAGKLINLGLGLLTAMLVAWMVARCRRGAAEGSETSAYAFAFYYCSPAIIVFSAIAYVEMALTFYLFLALCLFLIYVGVDPGESRHRILYAVLCGGVCGLAAGCKYTGILFGIVPLCVFIFLHNLFVTGITFKTKILFGMRDATIFYVSAVALLLPWLIRNMILTGNPVFPLMYSIFGGRGWDAAHAAMWDKAHAPGPISLTEFGGSFWEAVLNSPLMPILAFLFIPLLILRPRAITSPARWMLSYIVVYCALWFFFTHRVDRFLAPMLPVLAVLSALGFAAWQEGWVGKALKWVVALCLAFTIYQGFILGSNLGAFTVGLHPGEKERFFCDHTDFYDVYQTIQFVNQNVKDPKAKILFFAEARAYYCDVDWLAPTVFNTNPLETALRECATPHETAEKLRKWGFTHLLVNWIEFQRLHKTYGAFVNFPFEKWARFQQECLTQLGVFGKPLKSGEYPILVYLIRER